MSVTEASGARLCAAQRGASRSILKRYGALRLVSNTAALRASRPLSYFSKLRIRLYGGRPNPCAISSGPKV